MRELADRMEKGFSESGKFSEEIYIRDDFQLRVQMVNEKDRRTQICKEGNVMIMTTIPWELYRVANAIEARMEAADLSDNRVITEYIGDNIVLRILVDKR